MLQRCLCVTLPFTTRHQVGERQAKTYVLLILFSHVTINILLFYSVSSVNENNVVHHTITIRRKLIQNYQVSINIKTFLSTYVFFIKDIFNLLFAISRWRDAMNFTEKHVFH